MTTMAAAVTRGMLRLREHDADLYGTIEREHTRQCRSLNLVASCSVVDPSVLACLASTSVNVTAEGYPGRRYHAGCDVIDEIEALAARRACSLFGAKYANVQPHSASTANYTVLAALLRPGDTLLGMQLDSGGHLTHGSPAALSGSYYNAIGYGLAPSGLIDFDQVAELARKHRPRLIICGATAHSRAIDFARFRVIADEVGAILLADVSHTAGLIAASLHPSPVDHAHVITACTHKQLFGPRGGMILSGRDADTLVPGSERTFRQTLQRAVFPFTQGAPAINVIAAKARALAIAGSPEFRERMCRVRTTAAAIADELQRLGLTVVGGGTENHIVLVDLGQQMSGLVAERALEECGIIVNKNRVPGDVRPALVTSGLRLGTNSIAHRQMPDDAARQCGRLLASVLAHVTVHDDRSYLLPASVRDEARAQADLMTARYPLPGYEFQTPGHAHGVPEAPVPAAVH
jgi:glycine hydroxymethyltransferase